MFRLSGTSPLFSFLRSFGFIDIVDLLTESDPKNVVKQYQSYLMNTFFAFSRFNLSRFLKVAFPVIRFV